MKRNLDFNEISDGKKYKCDDLARVSCNGCKNCHECCDFTDDTIHLDPYDVLSLYTATGKNFSALLAEGIVSLTVVDGVITPYLNKKADGTCIFLSCDGRCSIHEYRPGFCRMFPLGRIYNDDDTFDYFIQIHECPYPSKSKVKIKTWLNIPNISKYEKYICDYHKVISRISKETMSHDSEEAKRINMLFLNTFFIEPFSKDDFYNQVSLRINSFLSTFLN